MRRNRFIQGFMMALGLLLWSAAQPGDVRADSLEQPWEGMRIAAELQADIEPHAEGNGASPVVLAQRPLTMSAAHEGAGSRDIRQALQAAIRMELAREVIGGSPQGMVPQGIAGRADGPAAQAASAALNAAEARRNHAVAVDAQQKRAAAAAQAARSALQIGTAPGNMSHGR